MKSALEKFLEGDKKKKKCEVVETKTIIIDGKEVTGQVYAPSNKLPAPTMRVKGHSKGNVQSNDWKTIASTDEKKLVVKKKKEESLIDLFK